MNYFLPVLFSFVLTLLLGLTVLKVFPRLKLMDRPRQFGYKRKPVPFMGGVILPLVFIVSLLFFFPFDKHFLGLIGGTLVLVSINLIDDLNWLGKISFKPSPTLRLLFQVLAALVLIFAGIGITYIGNPMGGIFDLTSLRLPFKLFGVIHTITFLPDLFTIVWIVLVVNAINWSDGVPGESSGIATIAGLTIFGLSLSLANRADLLPQDVLAAQTVAQMSLVLAGSTFAFWLFDFPSPKIIIGNTGTAFLGFILAVLAIFSGAKIATAFLVLGFLVLDAIWVIFRRISQSRPPWQGRDQEHLHDRLKKIGLGDKTILILIYLVCLFFGVTALFLKTQGKIGVMVILAVITIILGLKLPSGNK
ncbi:hypothetical protein COT40_01055 [Candidatus Peregrinibacteria bacterium CG08_land_8_20_14_0_20_41_10]|nr:MAG: hypothetical protein AUJ78_01540 [Candidatus Peregrinibacteria bacterium CG1_02_41_10]PIS32240.1 MAG: hypothetical protein COT40_01055 [Candidatus Peregrinibacteria bacterium CG08_land_8_20_14_0_20_41_10]